MTSKDYVPVLAVDPGKMTGVAFLTVGPGEHRSCWAREMPLQSALAHAEEFMLTYEPYVVVERFAITQRTLKTSRGENWSLEGIGVLRYLSKKLGCPGFEIQDAGEAKRLGTNRRLENLGWRHPTPGDHTDDAVRHGVLWLVKHGHLTGADLGPA